MYSNKALSVLLSMIFSISALTQDTQMNALDSFSAKLITGLRANAEERVYVVTDKSVFRAGDYVWFNAFLFNAASKLSNRSRFVFVDVVNEKDTIVKRAILDAGGQLNSRIQFPDSLPTGFYWLRAYTKRMAEADTNDIFVRPLYVFAKTNNNLLKPRKTTTNDEAPMLHFYPEGDNLITGINSTVALFATINGSPITIDGIIKDNRDTTITKFSTNLNGLGKFEFEPSGYRRYKAVVNSNGKEFSYPLPPFKFFAGQLSVLKQPSGYKLRILLADSIYSDNALSYVAGISKDSLVFAGIGHGLYETYVDNKRLPAGITTFYLFDKNFRLLSERSIYFAGDLKINVTPDKNIYATHDKVTLNLSVTEGDQHVVPALLTISVSDSSFAYPHCDFTNLTDRFGAIDNFYLATNNCFNEEDIDLLMLAKNNTYGKMTAAKDLRTNSDDSLLYIKGQLVNNKQEASPGKALTLMAANNSFFDTDTTDNTGRFLFPVEVYPDSTEFAFSINDMNNKRVLNNEIFLDPIDYPKLRTPIALKQYLQPQPAMRQRVITYHNAQWVDAGEPQLPPVTVRGEKKPDYDVSKRVSQYSAILTAKDLDETTSLDISILKVSGLQLLNGYLVIHGLNSMQTPGPRSEPIVLVEGTPAPLSSDGIGGVSPVMGFLKTINPMDVDFIEILKGAEAANYGVRGGNGVILINLSNKRHLLNSQNGMQVFYLPGVSKPALFSNPVYEPKDKKAAPPPDYRSTIFWNGNFLTANTNTSTLTFYTSDVAATYNVSITGITVHGDVVHQTISIQSK